jgi:uncharacterized integral membrane protein
MLLFVTIYEPLVLVYQKGDETEWEIILDILIIVIFFIDMIINFNTAYFTRDVRLIDHHKVFTSVINIIAHS